MIYKNKKSYLNPKVHYLIQKVYIVLGRLYKVAILIREWDRLRLTLGNRLITYFWKPSKISIKFLQKEDQVQGGSNPLDPTTIIKRS